LILLLESFLANGNSSQLSTVPIDLPNPANMMMMKPTTKTRDNGGVIE
jgi:hypothetical protein